LTKVEAVRGSAGHFDVTLSELPRYVDTNRCIACGLCAEKCPSKVDDEFNQNLNKRKAAYVRYPQAVPLKYAIDAEHCIYFKKGKCRVCEKVCPANAIDFLQREKRHEIEVGALLLAPGLQPVDPKALKEYGYGEFRNVVTSLEFERMLSSTGPLQGHLVRSSDRNEPRSIAFLQCVGSRDVDHPYCSSVCCMYAMKEAIIAKEHASHDLDAAIFFMDNRAHGKEFERYSHRAREEAGIRFVRSRIHSIESAGVNSEDLRLTYVDEEGTLCCEQFDMVVLSMGLEVSKETLETAEKLGIVLDSQGFAETSCTDPTCTSVPGIFVCGGFSGPKDIPQSVVEASAASSQCAALLKDSRDTLTHEKSPPEERSLSEEPPRVGVFVCRCGVNIGSVVDVPEVKDYAKSLPGVVYAGENLFTCSQDTQQLIRDVIRDQKLNRVVIAACSPRTHESLFQETMSEAGLNRYLFELTNIRDHDAWVHRDVPRQATQKAKDLVRMAVSKVSLSEAIAPLRLEVTPAATVIGGGVAGMNAALNLADQGFKTYLVEKDAHLGGYASEIQQTWKGEEVGVYLNDLKEKIQRHPKIEALLGTEIIDVEGFVGNFATTVERDKERRRISHGVTILATGGRPLRTEEYLYGQTDRVTCWHELEALFRREPKRFEESEAVAFIQCVGSREPQRPYCSRVCCTASVRKAISLKEQKPDLQIYILYREMRTYAQRESLYRRARQLGIIFIRYSLEEKPDVKTALVDGKEKVLITAKDHILGIPVRIEVDYLNLFTAILPAAQESLAKFLKVPLNDDGFFMEAHAKLRPVDFSTGGVFVCGLAHYPKPIEESIAQAQAAAMRASRVLTHKTVEIEPIVSVVDKERCIGCGLCEAVCPFGAVRVLPGNGKGYRAENLPALCKGCGLCAAVCPQKAIDMKHFRDVEISAAIRAGGENAMDAKTLPSRRIKGYSSVSGCRMADEYFFHRGHGWVSFERGGRLKIGVDDFTVKVLGPPEGLRIPPRGSLVHQGRTGCLFTRAGHRADLLSPATGKIFDVNRKVLENPEKISEDPYKNGWLIILEPVAIERDRKQLLSEEQGLRWMEKETERLLRLLGEEYERLAATGGEIIPDLFGHFPEMGWDRLVDTFFKGK
jgi:heterodisulfide reductase subunit A2